MGKIINLLIVVLAFLALTCSQDDDVINTNNIPVFPANYKTKIRAGYLRISFAPDAQFYYILAESQNDPKNDPLILWLNGGPGCSSLTGFFTQNGPFYFKEEDPSQMYLNPYRWNKKASVLYLESPALVGFSKATKPYPVQTDTSVAKDNLIALIQFFTKYSMFQGNDFYIAGESYAGIYIPQLAKQILDYNQEQQELHFNLMGLLIGNACTTREECTTPKYYSRYTTKFLYTRGFLEQSQYQDYINKCLINEGSESTNACITVQKNIRDYFLSTNANIYNIFAKCYTPKYPTSMQIQETLNIYQEKLEKYDSSSQGLKHPLRCTDAIGPLTILNANQYRAELKVDENNKTLFWTPCADVGFEFIQNFNYTMEREASFGYLPELVTAGLRIFYYSGDLDAIVPITGTLSWFDDFRSQFGHAVKRSWRPWITKDKLFQNNQNISGMVWELDSITLATIRGAGHMVPSDKPAEAEEILNVFLDPERGWTYPDYYIQSSFS